MKAFGTGSERTFVITSDDHEIGLFPSEEAVERSLEPQDAGGCRIFDSGGVEYELRVTDRSESRRLWKFYLESNYKTVEVGDPIGRSGDDSFVRNRLIERIARVDPNWPIDEEAGLPEIVATGIQVLGFGFT